MVDDISLNKAQIIERCIHRIEDVYRDDPANLGDLTLQDSIVLNIQRACEAAIGLAMHWVAENGWGVPNSSREAFDLLAEHHAIESELAAKLKAMVGFRNVAVHEYQKLDLDILKSIIAHNLADLTGFTRVLLSKD